MNKFLSCCSSRRAPGHPHRLTGYIHQEHATDILVPTQPQGSTFYIHHEHTTYFRIESTFNLSQNVSPIKCQMRHYFLGSECVAICATTS